MTESTLEKNYHAYEKILDCKENLLILASGVSWERYVEKVPCPMKFWIQDKQWKLISLKEFVLWRRYSNKNKQIIES